MTSTHIHDPETGEIVPRQPTPKPVVRLASGNGYAILMKCCDAAEKAGWGLEEWRAFSRKFRSGTWEQMFELVSQRFEVHTLPSFSAQPTNWKLESTDESTL